MSDPPRGINLTRIIYFIIRVVKLGRGTRSRTIHLRKPQCWHLVADKTFLAILATAMCQHCSKVFNVLKHVQIMF